MIRNAIQPSTPRREPALIQSQRKAEPLDIAETAERGEAWFFELGPNPKYYGPDSIQVSDLKKSRGVRSARRAFCSGGGRPLESAYKFDPREDWRALLSAGTNATEHFVGGYTYEIQNQKDGRTLFRLTNPTSWWSFLLHLDSIPKIIPRGGSVPLGGNWTQIYQWTESSTDVCACGAGND